MRTYLSPEFLAKFPGYMRFVVVARGVDNRRQHDNVVQLLEKAARSVRDRKDLAEPAVHPRISSWSEAFRAFGADPDESIPSVQALVTRARREDLSQDEEIFAYHNTVVALSNHISMKYLVPSGADDLVLVHGDFGLRLASGNELFVPMGSNDIEPPKQGEVVLADKRKVMCRRWVWKQGTHTMVTKSSRDIAVNVDVLPPVTREEGEQIAQELSDLLRRFCGGKVSVHILDKDHPVAELGTFETAFEETVYDTLELRGYIQRTSDRLEVRRLLSEGRIVRDGRVAVEGTTVYQGFDPTKPSLHVGHLMSLMVFHYLQQAGIRMIFILGGGTAQVGDPSLRSEGRKMITTEEVARNAAAVKAQVQGMGLVNFDEQEVPSGKPAAMMLDNSAWLHMDLLEFLRDVTPYFSVNRMIKREDFDRRLFGKSEAMDRESFMEQLEAHFAANDTIMRDDFRQLFPQGPVEGLSLFEFNYTALQGYDYLYLYDKYDCVIQMGGNDQWMNILDGMELIRRALDEASAYAMVFPLLVDRSGQKMGKTSEGETIWLAAEGEYSTSPFDFYQYWLRCPDEDLERNFKLFTFLQLDEIGQILEGHPRDAQHRLAFEVTKIVHGETTALQVQKDAQRVFGDEGGIPEEVPFVVVRPSDVTAGLLVRDVLADSESLPSKSEARRRIQQGGVRLNDVKLSDVDHPLVLEDFLEAAGEKAALLRYGKGKILKMILQ